MKKFKLILLLLLIVGGLMKVHAQTPVRPADAFVETIGINIHGNYEQYSGRTDVVVNTLNNIGFRHVRDAGGGQHFPGYDLWAWQKDVANRTGVKFDLIFGLGNSEETVAGQCDYLGTSVWGIEGENETDAGNHDHLVDFQQMLWGVSQGRDHINVLTWTYSVAVKFTDRDHANVESWTDFGAIHPYHKFGKHSPYQAGPMSSCYWDDLWSVGYIPGIRRQMVPAKPLVSTENGFSSGWQEDDQTGMSELASAKYNMRACLENFRLDFRKTYLYELINMSDDNTCTECQYGLARGDGSLKPAGRALKNMISIVQEKGKSNISTTPLNYSVSCPDLSVAPDEDGYSNEIHNIILQNSLGEYFIVLWQEANSYDWNERADINVPSVNVTVNFGRSFTSISRYVPLNSADIQQTWSNVSGVTVPVADHPVILKLGGGNTIHGVDLVVTDISWNPESPTTGNAVTFSATVKNQGNAATPAGTIIGVAFSVNDQVVSWSDNSSASLAARATRTLTANGGPDGATWTPPSNGAFTVEAFVDDVDRITETNNDNNRISESVTVEEGGFSGYYKLIAKHSGKALDVAEISGDDGANVHQWDYVGGDNQIWQIVNTGGGYYKLLAKHSGKALDLAGGNPANGANIQQYHDNGTDPQRWQIEPVEDGYYKLTNKVSGKVLDVADVSMENGANVHQWDYVGGDNQRWMLESVASTTSSRRVAEEPVSATEIYPNPALSRVTVRSTSSELKSVKLLNRSGRVIDVEAGMDAAQATIDISDLPSGVYVIKIETTDGKTEIKRLVVEK